MEKTWITPWKAAATAAAITLIPVLSIALGSPMVDELPLGYEPTLIVGFLLLAPLWTPLLALGLLLGLSNWVAAKGLGRAGLIAVLAGSLPIAVGGIAMAAWLNQDWSPENSGVWVQIWIWVLITLVVIHVFATFSVGALRDFFDME